VEAFEALRWSLHARRGQFLSRIPHKNGTPESPQWNRKKTASRGAFACILVCGWEGKIHIFIQVHSVPDVAGLSYPCTSGRRDISALLVLETSLRAHQVVKATYIALEHSL
jgi:hypothetical protein